MPRKKKKRIWRYVLGIFLLALLSFIVFYRVQVKIDAPTELNPMNLGYERSDHSNGLRLCDESWARMNEYGLGELYVAGGPLELGIKHGILLDDYIQSQEEAFVKQIKLMIPSESYLKFLKYFLAWFNKDLDTYIKQEYLLEIYGVSAFASDNFGFIGKKYDRILNYHGAHDIGHALQNMNLVACTAFGVWDDHSSDSSMLIGRNFDFYVGDDFARNKFIAFVKPDNGYKFAHITWAGMIGVVSGMNEKGLTITLNSAKSEIPLGARTPVSIIAREILQYASNIEEAMAIASARESFVSESFLIGSAIDNKTVVIEKSTDTTVLYDPGTNHIVLTNHFQSDHFMKDPLNIENIENETSMYRNKRLRELLKESGQTDLVKAARILRDRKGLGGKNIGNGNEKAINQLIAHHSIIFKPQQLKLWVSIGPFQQGEYICYDLDSVFSKELNLEGKKGLSLKEFMIPADTAFGQDSVAQYLGYKDMLLRIQHAIDEKEIIQSEQTFFRDLIQHNPEFYYTYYILGNYYQVLGNTALAKEYYNLALTKEASSLLERERIIEKIQECADE